MHYPTRDVHRPFLQCIHAVCATLPVSHLVAVCHWFAVLPWWCHGAYMCFGTRQAFRHQLGVLEHIPTPWGEGGYCIATNPSKTLCLARTALPCLSSSKCLLFHIIGGNIFFQYSPPKIFLPVYHDFFQNPKSKQQNSSYGFGTKLVKAADNNYSPSLPFSFSTLSTRTLLNPGRTTVAHPPLSPCRSHTGQTNIAFNLFRQSRSSLLS